MEHGPQKFLPHGWPTLRGFGGLSGISAPQVSKRGRLPDVFYKQKHPKYEQLKHCVVKTKTNHVAVLQTLSTTFQFLRAFWILVVVIVIAWTSNHILFSVF